MRLILSVLLISALAVGLACNSAAKPQISKIETPKSAPPTVQAETHNHADDANTLRITLEEAKKAFDAGTAVFVDTRDVSSYRFSRIKGAIHLPAESASIRWKEIPTGKKIIAYCSWREEHTSAGLVQILNKNGITNAYALKGGTEVWRNAGFPMEGEQPTKQ